MKHFEEIWNESEVFAKNLKEESLDDIIKVLHSRIDNLSGCANLPRDQAINIGEILFELARVASITELRNKKGVNVAQGMIMALENRKSELLDPEIDDEDNTNNAYSSD